MLWKQLFGRKTLEGLLEEAAGENRLRRILGPINLTALGVGAIIGSGIFVMTGEVTAQNAGPAIMLSFVVAGLGCLFAALCYAEFASMAPVAGSAYTYAYATLGELLAWIIGWDLILEYAMACAVVAAGWSKYLNELLYVLFSWKIPAYLCNDPFTLSGGWLNLPALLITLGVTVILVIGIRESATTNAVLVGVKVGVVLFVIGAGVLFIDPRNWTGLSPSDRIHPEDISTIPAVAAEAVKKDALPEKEVEARVQQLTAEMRGLARLERKKEELDKEVAAGKLFPSDRDAALAELRMKLAHSSVPDRKKDLDERLAAHQLNQAQYDDLMERAQKEDAYLPATAEEEVVVRRLLAEVKKEAPHAATENWGMLGYLGLNTTLETVDDRVRSPFMPYGLAGIIFAASIVFFAYIGFDAVSTHAEEAKKPARDVPIAILASLFICTVLYMAVAAVLCGMVPYYKINPDAAVANAFTVKGIETNNRLLLGASGLISLGALAGMTSVLLITFLSQARIFLAMARDGLLPPAVFGAIHERFRTPHISTMLTGGIISLVAAFTPITDLEKMVNIGTLMAFIIVCAAVLILRVQKPNAERPFRTPWLYVVAPAGIIVNLIMMLFLPPSTWLRLVGWLVVGLLIYFSYGIRNSLMGQQLQGLIPRHIPAGPSDDGAPHAGSPAPIGSITPGEERVQG
jgi:amino acid transporter